jgi:HAD superfamily hydrolase (TIGR01549 family)
VIKAVVLDIGETLIDESRLWSRWADRLGVPTLTMLGLIGAMAALDRPHREALALVRPGIDVEAEVESWRQEDPHGLRDGFDEADLYPDVRPAIAGLRDHGVDTLVAGNQPRRARPVIEGMNLGVRAVMVSEEMGVEKPSRAFFEAVVATAAVGPAEVLYVGDRLDNDILPARAAGLRTALLKRGPWGFVHSQRPEARRAHLILDSLIELPDRLAELG